MKKNAPLRRKSHARKLLVESLESRLLLNSDWRNPTRPLDVDNDFAVTPLDALTVVNAINRDGFIPLPATRPVFKPLVDVNGDRLLSPLDALEVINSINSKPIHYTYPRSGGESEPYPIGFLSVPLGKTKGQSGQKVPLVSTLSLGREEFNEFGVFITDDENGLVNGIAPGQDGYADAVFQSADRRVLYSRLSVFRSASDGDLPANSFVRVYVLQSILGSGIPEDHLRVRQTSSETIRVGWEEFNSSANSWQSVGDRGYDDSTVEISLGDPISGNNPPTITAIPNQIVDELSLLELFAVAEDPDLPNDSLVYSLEIAPDDATIDPATGRIAWTPSEEDGPGNFEFQVRVTDRAGSFDSVSFFVTVLEVNQPPILSVPQSLSVEPGETIGIAVNATDLDFPVQALSYSLLPGAPQGVTIDNASGNVRWSVPDFQPSGIYPISVRVTDNGSPSLSDTQTIAIEVGCEFDATLSGWRVFENGGNGSDKGTVLSNACTAVLREGNSFVVGLEKSFLIPSIPTAIQFTYEDLNFDTTSTGRIKDSFEVAIVDRDGNALVSNFFSNRDAFFNITEGLPAVIGSGIHKDGETVTVDLSAIPNGTNARIIFRLSNNDSDDGTIVTIRDFKFVSSTSPANAAFFNNSSGLSFQQQHTIETNPFSPAYVSPYVLSTPTALSPHLNSPSRLSSPFTAEIEWSKDNFAFRPDSNQVMMTPSVADIDKDGVPDVVFSTFSRTGNGGNSSLQTGVLRAISGVNGDELWSVVSPVNFIEAYGGVAVGDLDGDSEIEIIAHTVDNRVVAFASDGTFKWVSQSIRGGIMWGSSAIADLDSDGLAEIVIGSTVLNYDGTTRWVGLQGTGNNGAGPLSVVADLDLDGTPEIISGNTAYRNTGEVFWQSATNDGFPAIGNFDSDPQPEVVLVSGGAVYLLEHNGVMKWGPRFIPAGGLGGAPTVADFDGDGEAEIGVAGAGRYVVFESNGDNKWSTPTQDRSSNVTGSSVFDFDGDGGAEVVYGDELALRIYDGNTGTVRFEIARGSGTTYEYPLVVDVDGDGNTEIVCTANNYAFGSRTGIFVLGNKEWVPTREVWNQHSYHITNINDDGSIPLREPNSWQVYNNYRRNRQPTGTQFGPPSISITTASNRVPAGTMVLVQGISIADGKLSSNQTNNITTVTANQRSVLVLDSLGRFYDQLEILPGVNRVEYVAMDAAGQKASLFLEINGVTPDDTFEFSKYSDISGSFGGLYYRTSFNEQTDILFAELATRNEGQFASNVPLLVGVKNISDPAVSLVGIDGFTPDGIPFYDYSTYVTTGRLSPGEQTESPSVAFHNPKRVQFDYELVFWGKLNESPYFTTVPNIEALVGRSYLYNPGALDPDQDTVSYSLLVAPNGMAIDSTSGIVTWAPTVQQVGQHDVTIQVVDGRGGIGQQRFTLTAIEPPPNRPPVITSTPLSLTQANSLRRNETGGKAIVSNDEWTMSDAGFAQSPIDTNEYVLRVAEFFTGDAKSGRFLAFSNNFGLTGTKLADRMKQLGHEWVVTTNMDFTLDNLKQYDAVFLGGVAVDNDILIRYLETGGNVYLNGGTGVLGSAASEAATWNRFLGAIGLQYKPEFNWLIAVIPLPETPHPVFPGLRLYQSNGNSIVDLDEYDNKGFLVANHDSGGLFAVYDGRFSSVAEDVYRYDVVAIDPDQDNLRYRLLNHPEGMWIDSELGVVRWVPQIEQIGDHIVRVEVSDGLGGVALQEFNICVVSDSANSPPEIISRPLTTLSEIEFTPGAQSDLMFTVPGVVNEPVSVTFRWTIRSAAYNNEFGIYRVDDENGAVAGFLPGESSYSRLALSETNSTTIFESGQGVGATKKITLKGGEKYGFYIIQNSNKLVFLANNPDNNLSSQPLAFLSFPTANPDGLDHLITTTTNAGETQFAWEDLTGVGDSSNPNNFKDVVFTIDLALLPGNRKAWTYQVESLDANEDTLTYSLVRGPIGASINSSTGELSWLAERGTFPFLVQVSDGRGGFDEQSFDLTVMAGGVVRGRVFVELDSESTVNGIEGRQIFSDSNGNGVRDDGEIWTLTDESGFYTLGGLPPGPHRIQQVPLRGWTQVMPVNSDEGYLVTISSQQNIDGLNFRNQEKRVSPNSSPVISAVSSASAVFGEGFQYSVLANDSDYDPLLYALITHPDGMTIHPQRGVIVWFPDEDQIGQHQVVLRVKDDRGGVALQSFTITVVPPNTAPVFMSETVARTIAGRTFTHRLHAIDADNDNLTFALTNAPQGMSIETIETQDDDGHPIERFQQIRWDVPLSSANSIHSFNVRVSDGRGGESIQSWTLQIFSENAPNSVPFFTSTPNKIARIGRPWVYLPVVRDTDGDSISYSLVDSPAGMKVNPDGLISWTPPADTTSLINVSVRATDGRGGQSTQSFTLEIQTREQNNTPYITSVPPTRVLDGELFKYDPFATDTDADPLTWSLAQAPQGMSIDSQSGAIRWIPDDFQLGSHQVAVTVIDPQLASYTQRFTLEIACSNLPPAILSIPPTTAIANRSYLYAPRGIDPEQNTLTWYLLSKPQGMTIDQQTGLIRWTPAAGQIGPHDVAIEVRDGLLVGRQTFRIVVSSISDETKSNRSPLITSTPVFSGESGATYQYQVIAIDPDGDTLEFQLSRNPFGMSVNADGLISWNPTAADAGDHLIGITARDSRGAIATQGFLLSITQNQPPVITSTPITTSVAGSTYRYSVRASDPNGDVLTYKLSVAPAGMTIDKLGRILWNSAATLTTPQNVSLAVSDNRGQSATQSFTIDMLADTQAPRVNLAVSTSEIAFSDHAVIDVGSNYTVQVFATDNVAVSQIGLLVDGKPVTLSATGSISLHASTIGTIQLSAFALDSSGMRGEVSGSVVVVPAGNSNLPNPGDPDLPPHPGFDPSDSGIPIVEILSPAPATTVSNRVPIIGTVDDPEDNLWYYRALYARADRVSITSIDLNDPDWTIFHESTKEVINGELAIFDSSILTNDPYAIVIAGYDGNGQGYVAGTLVFVEGNVLVGNFRLEFTDLTIPLAGLPIQINRIYDTLNAADEGDFGFGWTLGIQDARVFEAGAIGVGGAFNGGDDKFVPDKTKVYLTNPEGKRVGFTYKEQYVSGAAFLIGCTFGCFYRPYFQADPGVYDTLTIDETQVSRGGILGAVAAGINPEYYNLTNKEGVTYRYHDVRGLEKVTDRNGNVLSYSNDGIKHSLGDEVQFIRDHRGRIKEIIAPDGTTLSYQYDAVGDLVKHTNQTGLTSRYEYLGKPAHYLDASYDESNTRVFKAQYDNELRFVGVFDALGNQVDKREFDTANNTGIIRDGNGNPTTLLYDDRGNILQETDPQGNTTIRRYEDPRNPDLETTIIDRRGMTTKRSFDERGNLLTITETGSSTNPLPNPVVTTFTYDSTNDVTSITNAKGGTAYFEYDTKGNVTKIINAIGDSTVFTYDSQGRRASVTDFNGNKTVFEYHDGCGCGAPSKIIYPDGTYQTYKYNDFGQITLEQIFEANGSLAERKQTEYDSQGRVTREIIGGGNDPNHPATDIRKFYSGQLLAWEIIVNPASLDANGLLMESPATPVAERKSRITEYRYDAKDQLITQIDAMGGVIDFRYDAQGNRILLRDPVGNITTWTYDTLNRISEERDPFYWVSFVEANSSLSSNAILDAVVVENRKPSGASLANNQGAAHVRSFGYDSEGNQSEVIDRNNRRREFSYDQNGRLLTEQWFAANNGPLVETITFTYDLLGNIKTAQNANSKYIYEYDQLNRVKSVDNFDSNPDTPRVILNYEYDLQGNLIRTSDDAGVTVQSTYSKKNQLETRKWFDAIVPAGGTKDVANARVDFSYTAAGRQKQIRRYSDLSATSKVGSTDYTYDLSGRSNTLIHKNVVDALISSYDYGYDFSGLLVDEERDHSNNAYDDTITYGYDLTGQLVDAAFNSQDDEHYDYDLNGNRRSSVKGNESRVYSFGSGNQLVSNSVFENSYDFESNVTHRRQLGDPTTNTTFAFNNHNQLTKVTAQHQGIPDSQTIFEYDVHSRRITKRASSDIQVTVYHGPNAWFESTSTETKRFLSLDVDNQLATYSKSTGVTWLLTDRLGTVVGIQTGNELTFFSSDTFGNSTESLSFPTGLGGRDFDKETGLYFFRSRYLDPSTGTFISQDGIGFESGQVNLFSYVRNSPNNFTDPFGYSELIERGTLEGIVQSLNRCLQQLGIDLALDLAIEAAENLALSGIYVGLDLKYEGSYVGRAEDLKRRLAHHHRTLEQGVYAIVPKGVGGDALKKYFANIEQYFIEQVSGGEGPRKKGDRFNLSRLITNFRNEISKESRKVLECGGKKY